MLSLTGNKEKLNKRMIHVLSLDKTEIPGIDSVVLTRSDLSLMASIAINGFSKYAKLCSELDNDDE